MERPIAPEIESAGLLRPTVDGLSIMGDPWSFLILRESLFGVQRFDEMRRLIGSAKSILASRLTEMVAAGVLSRRPSQAGPHRPIYKLTRIGVDTFGVVVALVQWGDRWLAGDAGPPLVFTHRSCGKQLKGELRCAGCGQPVALKDIARADTPTQSGRPGVRKRMRRASDSAHYLRGRNCSGARTIRIIGNRWTLMILLEILSGVRRFGELQKSLSIARNILSSRLSGLVEAGILVRRIYRSAPTRHEYGLTAKGRDLLAVCLLLKHWSDKWFGGEGRDFPGFIHTVCRRPLVPAYTCASCGEDINAFDVTHTDGPGAGMSEAHGKPAVPAMSPGA